MSDDDDLLAAELAFGLLDPADALAAEQRVDTDAGFAQAYARWVGHAAALTGGGAGEAPRPSLWAEIVARLPANDNSDVLPPERALRWWQGGTAIAASLALVFGIVALERPPSAPRPVAAPASASPPPLVAVLSAKAGDAVVTVSFDRSTGRLVSAPRGMALGDHVPELWVIPADGKPRSLGVIAAAAPGWTRAPPPAAPALTPGATLAISVEPQGGSPTGQPTGPVILSGTVITT